MAALIAGATDQVFIGMNLRSARLGRKGSIFRPGYSAEALIEISLSKEEFQLLTLIDGKRTLYEVCTTGPFGVSENARLTAKLTGWQVDIEAEQVAVMGFEEKIAQAVKALAAIPGIAEEDASALVQHGLTSLEDLLQAEVSDLAEMPEIGDKAVAVMDAAKAEATRRSFTVV